MNSNFGTLIVLFVLGLLASCGNQPTKAKFEITTSAITAANNSYQGGFVIMGKSASGEFTIPVKYLGTSSSNSITLDVPKDSWTFWAIAWDGGGAAVKEFQGTTRCGVTKADLKNDTESVRISLDSSFCSSNSSIFGNSSYFGGSSYQNFRIATCGLLSGVTNSTDPSNFCLTSFEDIFRKYPKTIKVEVPSIVNGVREPGLKICITGDANGFYNVFNLSLPALGLPLTISLYESINCLEGGRISTFEFPNGLTGPQPSNQDTFFNNRNSTMNLFLPTSELKKGYSPVFASIPKIHCTGAPCMGVPPSISGPLLRSNRDFVIADKVSRRECSQISSVTPSSAASFGGVAPTTAIIKGNCSKQDDGSLTTRFSFTGPLSSASLSITWNDGNSSSFYFTEDPSADFFEAGWRLFGYPVSPAVDPAIAGSFEIFYKNDHFESRGFLRKVANMLSADGPGGLFGQASCTNPAEQSGSISFLEDGVRKTYRAILIDNPVDPARTVTSFMNGDGYSTGQQLTKRMIVQRLADDLITFNTEVVIDFICGAAIGKFESTEVKDGKEEHHKIEWNTVAAGSQRAQAWSLEKEIVAGVVTRYTSTYRKAMKISGTQAAASSSELEVKWNGSSYDYTARKVMGYSDQSQSRVFISKQEFPQNSFSSSPNAAGFATAVPSNLATSNDQCLDLAPTSFGFATGSPCSTVSAAAIAGGYYSGAPDPNANYLETNFTSTFNAALETVAD